ncbi:MAG: hypothetical protein V4560_14720 [Bacteroidota bacterium]
MKKKEAIQLIERSLPQCIHAILLKDKKGNYSVAMTKECVDYQVRYNTKRITALYSFLGLPGKIKIFKTKNIK